MIHPSLTRYLRVLAVLVSGIAASVSYAGPYEDAQEAYDAGDYETAFKQILPEAEQGNVRAQTQIATMYMNGMGVDRSSEEALKWLQTAAGQNDAIAQNMLGDIYSNGKYMKPELETAVEWYRKAANQGEILAQYSLGASYFRGNGVPQDYVMSYAWMLVAQHFGHETAGDYAETIASVLSPEDLARGKSLADELSRDIKSQTR